jgi:hypothetical protein
MGVIETRLDGLESQVSLELTEGPVPGGWSAEDDTRRMAAAEQLAGQTRRWVRWLREFPPHATVPGLRERADLFHQAALDRLEDARGHRTA